MEIITDDEKKYVDIGSYAIWQCLYSTVKVRLANEKKRIPLGIDFLRTGKCSYVDAIETARQINVIRDLLSQVNPSQMVYDHHNLMLKAPWYGNISYVVTSCANFFLTADGKDLLYELVSILTYADSIKVNVNSLDA